MGHERPLYARVGFLSALAYAVLLTAVNTAFIVMIAVGSEGDWAGIESYSRTYRTIAFVPQTIGLLAIPAAILMLASIHVHIDRPRKVWSTAGLLFGGAHGLLLGALYFVQVGVVLPSLRHGRTDGLEQFAFANPSSVAWGLNHFAWALLGVALVVMAFGFGTNGLGRWIRALFFFNGIANISLLFSFAYELEALTLGAAALSWVVGLPLSAILVAIMFRRTQGETRGGRTTREE